LQDAIKIASEAGDVCFTDLKFSHLQFSLFALNYSEHGSIIYTFNQIQQLFCK
jgi:hypothetical protein